MYSIPIERLDEAIEHLQHIKTLVEQKKLFPTGSLLYTEFEDKSENGVYVVRDYEINEWNKDQLKLMAVIDLLLSSKGTRISNIKVRYEQIESFRLLRARDLAPYLTSPNNSLREVAERISKTLKHKALSSSG